MDAIDQLLAAARAYAAFSGIELTTVSWRLFADSKKLDALVGGSDIQVRRHEAAMRWLSDGWPDHCAWPEGVARPANLETDEPGSHGGEVSVDDPTVLAPCPRLGADNPERNVSRTSATAFAHTQAAQAISKSDPAQCAGRSDAVVGSVAGDAVQSAAQDQAREGVAAGDPAGFAQLESSEVGEADLDPSSPADASDRLDAKAVAIADVDDWAGEGLTGAQFSRHRPSVRNARAGVSLRHARDCAESGGDESDPNHDGNLKQTEIAA